MREIDERASASPLPRSLKATALALFGATVIALAPPSLAGSSAEGDAKTQGADNTAAKDGKPPCDASAKLAAARDTICRTITSYASDVQDAYHRELVKNPKIDGEITVAFSILPDGAVADVRVEKSSLNWPPLEHEILSRVRAWKFPAFEGEPIPATVPYKFGPR